MTEHEKLLQQATKLTPYIKGRFVIAVTNPIYRGVDNEQSKPCKPRII